MKISVFVLLFLACWTCLADTSYRFCMANPDKGRYQGKVNFNIDLGKEAARQLLSREAKPYLCCPITISDFRQDYCGDRDLLEVTGVNIDGKIAETILNDPLSTPAALVESVDALTQDVEDIIEEPGQIVDKPVNELKRFGKKLGL